MLSGSSVVGRELFYNQSTWDGGADSITTSDDAAIATDKTAYLPGAGAPSSTNLSSYFRGINGIMVDLLGDGSHTSIAANDFVFKTGNDNSPSGWSTASAPLVVTVRTGAGVSGSDRVEILWGSNAVENAWLEVQVLATAHTGLAATDVFFWANRIGDANLNFSTTGADSSNVLAHIGGDGSITSTLDFNRSKTVSGTDSSIAIANVGSTATINVGDKAPRILQLSTGNAAVYAGADLTLTASEVSDPNGNTAVSQVAFYLDDGDGVFNSSDTLLDTATTGTDGIWYKAIATGGANPVGIGKQLFFAKATNAIGIESNVIAIPGEVLTSAPVVEPIDNDDIISGRRYVMQAKADLPIGVVPEAGEVTYELELASGPIGVTLEDLEGDGLVFNEDAGTIIWDTTDEDLVNETPYHFQITATYDPGSPIESAARDFYITVQDAALYMTPAWFDGVILVAFFYQPCGCAGKRTYDPKSFGNPRFG